MASVQGFGVCHIIMHRNALIAENSSPKPGPDAAGDE